MNRNVPSLPVTLTRVPCSEGLEASTVTPGSGFPSVPMTVPVISPVVCAPAPDAIRRRPTDDAKIHRRILFTDVLLLSESPQLGPHPGAMALPSIADAVLTKEAVETVRVARCTILESAMRAARRHTASLEQRREIRIVKVGLET